MSKTCECGRQGHIIDSRQRKKHTARRYSCSCGLRWSTCEIRLPEGVTVDHNNLHATLVNVYTDWDRTRAVEILTKAMKEIIGGTNG